MQPYQLNPEVAPQFEMVNDFIINHLGSNVPLVEKIGHYIVESGGKRLRPLLVLLAANACQYKGDRHISLAAVIEFIHTATLLHDDVVDNSELRRGKDTANAKWGNAPSVLVGDFLYSRAFQIMVDIGSLPIMGVISNATTVIAEGEVLQLLNSRNPDTTEEAYMQVILGKTAMLFEAATEVGALLADASDKERVAMRDYGRHIGIAFQLIDDVMDYKSTAEEMGKNVGDDLAEGKPTLPLIQAMKVASEPDKKLIRKAIREGGLEDLEPIMNIVSRSGAITYTEEMAQQQADLAIKALEPLSDTSFKQTLIKLANIAANRSA
ncbi:MULTISPECIES: polyprenyl synthetase family protein [Neptunomonas]|jgi:octaprenyl-diphosphate synthase|uniref:Octaprenyl diphosphate synthase n=1 Tax=Neptunomonas phycophila TaxID=1572645 RepID=A0AAW7XI64_9GAMM|nr:MULTISPECIES: polyprenyl synthetase family protein [Neptunomonas]MDN2658999.1 polyprenyl synthetase family protein [Neptunomonas sp. CHC150]MDO6452974.1 polyprenyl synthetase family protein [Neptunomonas phycophila]QLE96228.1 octaprenyl diphosphate synthase [Neptunomonas phycophila]